jgi:hypothetical protein
MNNSRNQQIRPVQPKASNAGTPTVAPAARRTFGAKFPSRRTFGGKFPSRRTFGSRLPSCRTLG